MANLTLVPRFVESGRIVFASTKTENARDVLLVLMHRLGAYEPFSLPIVEAYIARKDDPSGFAEGELVLGLEVEDANALAEIRAGRVPQIVLPLPEPATRKSEAFRANRAGIDLDGLRAAFGVGAKRLAPRRW